jgi:small subunit ribosomal protein S27e
MVRKERVLYPRPKSNFLLVKCPSCGTERVVYSHATVPTKCESCGEVLTEPRGGKTQIKAQILRKMD